MSLASNSRTVLRLAVPLCLVASLGCEGDRSDSTPSLKQQSAKTEEPRGDAQLGVKGTEKSPSVESKVASKTAQDGPHRAAVCLSEKEIKDYDPMGFRLRGTHSVVRVARDDTLALRENPSPKAPILEQISHDADGLRPTGQVCLAGKSHWWEVAVGARTGWVNSRFVGRLTAVHDATAKYKELSGESPEPTPWALTNKILREMNTPPQDEGHYEAELVDLKVSGRKATATIYACCELDDSVDGEQTEISLVLEDGGWRLEGASHRYLCGRGVSEDGQLCM